MLNDLDEKRAELAAQRNLLDDYIQQQQQQSQKVSLENNHSNGFATSVSIVGDATTELELKLRQAVTWAEECEAKLATQEAYWANQRIRWQRERSDLQDRVREIVLERVR